MSMMSSGPDDPNFDENGKALFGTPGAGTYEKIDSVGRTVVYPNAPQYPFGVKHRKNPFVSKEHAHNDYGGQDSPGPAYKPSHTYKSKKADKNGDIDREAAFSFGTADRGAERMRFISRPHCRENMAATTPGPGTYKRKEGKGIAKSMGDAPTWKFGTGPQREFMGNLDNFNVPGPGQHDHHTTLSTSEYFSSPPAYTFAPFGDTEAGSYRSKDELEHVFISQQHQKQLIPKDTPAPGEYVSKSSFADVNGMYTMDANTSSRFHPSHSFGTTRRYSEMTSKPFISKEHVDPDLASPGPCYKLPESQVWDGPKHKIGTAQKFYQPELGENKAGPVVSTHFSASQASMGANSPGPAQYEMPEGKGIAKTIGDAPTWKFGSERRATPGKGPGTTDWVPGPGAYEPKKQSESTGAGGKQFSQMPTYSVASCLRSDPVAAGSDPEEPGPGQYKVEMGIQEEDCRKREFPKWSFGKDKNRSSFMSIGTASEVPGPGAYQHERTHDFAHPSSFNRAWSFGHKLKERNPPERHSKKMYISALHTSDQLAADTPAPSDYKITMGKGIAKSFGDAPTFKFGTRKKIGGSEFISKAHSRSDKVDAKDTPGPGAHNPKGLSGMSNKFKNNHGWGFGTSKRPPLATVKF